MNNFRDRNEGSIPSDLMKCKIGNAKTNNSFLFDYRGMYIFLTNMRKLTYNFQNKTIRLI